MKRTTVVGGVALVIGAYLVLQYASLKKVQTIAMPVPQSSRPVDAPALTVVAIRKGQVTVGGTALMARC